ncbi:hypothetical protein [Streptomyces sp. Da 82-17]|uniref:hypothetical protein n=1 Tax=Streptomyces sp. Da 82-17 TaxID=3377116 RepID=UPI0038D46622
MSEPVDPRVAFAVTAEPTPSPSPGPSPDPDPEPERPDSGPHRPEPTPGPTGPYDPPPDGLQPPQPWGTDPDVGVTPSWVRGRADACDTASETIRKTIGIADDACADLAKAAPGWDFVHSIDDMQRRWEELNRIVTDRLNLASENFRSSAAAYETNEARTAQDLSNIYR